MPFSAFMWPPPRRRKKAAQGSPSESNEAPATAVFMATGAFGAAYPVAKPFVSRSRRGSVAPPAGTGNTLKESSGFVAAVVIDTSNGSVIRLDALALHWPRIHKPAAKQLPASPCRPGYRERIAFRDNSQQTPMEHHSPETPVDSAPLGSCARSQTSCAFEVTVAYLHRLGAWVATGHRIHSFQPTQTRYIVGYVVDMMENLRSQCPGSKVCHI